MVKTVGAVIVGFAVIFAIAFAVFAGLYAAVGADRAFRPGTFELSTLWLAVAYFVYIIAGFVGGRVAAAIAPGGRAPRILGLLVLAFGLAMALRTADPAKDTRPFTRSGSSSMSDGMRNARTPNWAGFSLPIVLLVGVRAGGVAHNRGRV
jgi:hypothetical protein